MDTEIRLRPPTIKLFQYIGMLAEREGFPIRLQPVDEHSFIFFIPYQMLADLTFKLIKEKYPDVAIKAVGNKIVFYVQKDIKQYVLTDINEIVENIYKKLKIRIAIDIPSDNELIIIARAEPLAVMIAQLILREVKKRNPDAIRMFKFLKGELDVPNFGYSLVIGVKYVYSDIDKLEDMVK